MIIHEPVQHSRPESGEAVHTLKVLPKCVFSVWFCRRAPVWAALASLLVFAIGSHAPTLVLFPAFEGRSEGGSAAVQQQVECNSKCCAAALEGRGVCCAAAGTVQQQVRRRST